MCSFHLSFSWVKHWILSGCLWVEEWICNQSMVNECELICKHGEWMWVDLQPWWTSIRSRNHGFNSDKAGSAVLGMLMWMDERLPCSQSPSDRTIPGCWKWLPQFSDCIPILVTSLINFPDTCTYVCCACGLDRNPVQTASHGLPGKCRQYSDIFVLAEAANWTAI